MWRRSTSCQLNGSSVKLRSPKAARWIILLAASYELAARSKRQLRCILSLLTVGGPKRRSREGLDTYLRRFLLPPIIADS